MRHLLIGTTAAATIVVTGSVWAQVLPPGAAQPWPPAAYSVLRYPFPAPTPDDAYRQGLINRVELERFAGPLPQALQGPSVDGSRGGSGERR